MALRDARVLAFPDAQKEFSLYTDASKFHMSRVLMEGDKAAPKVIGYWSKSFKGSQINWSALVKEVWAVYEACKHFSVFILGAPTTLYCDHKPLANFLRNQTKNAIVNRWSLDIQEYALKFVWVDTHTNISDCLSWLVENDLYQEHDEIESDFPEGSMGRARQHVNEEVLPETEVLRGYPILHAIPVKQQESVAVSTSEDFSTLGLTELDRKQVAELQEKDSYIRRVIAASGKCTMKMESSPRLTMSGTKSLSMDRRRSDAGGSQVMPCWFHKPSSDSVGEHPLRTATPRAGQDVECSAAQGVLEINAERCGQADTGL